jgi:hypothetical protein
MADPIKTDPIPGNSLESALDEQLGSSNEEEPIRFTAADKATRTRNAWACAVSPCALIIFFFAFGFEDYDPSTVLGLAICVCSLVFSFFLALAYFGAMGDDNKNRNCVQKQFFGLEWDELLKMDTPYGMNEAFSFLVGPGLAITIPVLIHSALTLAELQASIPCLTSFG